MLFAGLLLLSSVSFAHEGGHGPKIPGTGPSGGLLTAVVAATDIELGENAPVYAVAEYSRVSAHVGIQLWSQGFVSMVEVPAGDLKWIFLLRAPLKPVVTVVTQASAQSHFAYEMSQEVTANVETVELILPALAARTGKHVLAFSLEP